MITVSLGIDTADRLAFQDHIERILNKYGPEPAPHLVKEFERDMEQAYCSFCECFFTFTPDTEVGLS